MEQNDLPKNCHPQQGVLLKSPAWALPQRFDGFIGVESAAVFEIVLVKELFFIWPLLLNDCLGHLAKAKEPERAICLATETDF
jgi:hypothetical protein